MTPLPSRRLLTGLWAIAAPGVGDEIEVGVVHPDRVDHVHALGKQAEIGGVADQRPAGEARLLVGEHALQLGLQHVRVERQVVAPAQLVERAKYSG